VKQIVLAGYNSHRVEGAPAGTTIIHRNYLEQPQHAFNVPSDESEGRAGFTSRVHSAFGVQPMTIQYEYNKSSFEVGPGAEKWRASYSSALVREVERELFLAENEDLEFKAIFRRGPSGREQSALTSFALSGPKQLPADWLSKPALLVVRADERDNRFIVDRTNEVFSLQAHELKPLASPEKDVPGRTTAIVFDEPRNRLLAWHSREHRQKNGLSQLGRALIAYDALKGAWQQIGSPGADIGAVALDAKEKVFYGLALPHFSNAITDLVVMNQQGAVLSAVRLSEPFYWDLHAGPPQAVFARGHLIIITPPQAALLPNNEERLVSKVIAINPATGQTFFTGRYFCD
jgi:hypothetical protein